ncbi:MAG: hypothetical protein ACFCD0_15905 [Gemmataceae bacterium]
MNAKKWNFCRDPERMIVDLFRRMDQTDNDSSGSYQLSPKLLGQLVHPPEWSRPSGRPTLRKLWLFGLACCEWSLPITSRIDVTDCVQSFGRLLEGSDADLRRKLRELCVIGKTWSQFDNQSHGLAVFRKLFRALVSDFDPKATWDRYGKLFRQDVRIYRRTGKRRGKSQPITIDRETTCDLLRDIFRHTNERIPLEGRWLTEDVVRVASTIYDENRFTEMAILADALEEAGCHCEDILSHCREAPFHVRGCWVLDAVLGQK